MRRPSIVEVKRRLDGSETRFACEAALLEPGRRAVVVYVLDRTWEVADLTLGPGITTFGHFWMDRPYNVYHWLQAERTVGHYVNVGRCEEITRERVLWTDYAVDVLATPDGRTRVLDEGELGAEVTPAIRDLVNATRAHVVTTMASLMREVETETRRLI